MLYLNQTTIAGNLTRDCEIKEFSNGGSIINFTVAVNRSWTDSSGQKQERAEYINCVKKNPSDKQKAFFTDAFTKGSHVYLSGEMRTRSYRVDGEATDRYVTEIDVNSIELIGSKSATTQAHAPAAQPEQMVSAPVANGYVSGTSPFDDLDAAPF